VTHRLLRDHPDKITRGATLDIVPTLYRFETIDQKAATGSWHWFFLIQGRGLPEHMIGGDPEFFLRHIFGTLLHDEDAIEPAAWTEYLRCFRHPETIRATCDEYRAGASIDLIHDRADLSQKVRVPMLVLWGTRSGQGAAMTSSGCGATMPATCAAAASIAATLSQRSSRTRSMPR
jgi:haloacetate dehalogenase